eukprot:scaffold75148_cov67-Cyclotella_meneghiniana.AAC.3
MLVAIWENSYISSLFPFESFRVFVGSTKTTSSIKLAIYEDWGRKAVRDLMEQSKVKVVSSENFIKMYWEGMNPQLSRDVIQDIENICPCCGSILLSAWMMERTFVVLEDQIKTRGSHLVRLLTFLLAVKKTQGGSSVSSPISSAARGGHPQHEMEYCNLAKRVYNPPSP